MNRSFSSGRSDVFTWFARIAVALSFLSAVADRFGLWTPLLGSAQVAWGNMDSFTAYTGTLIPFVPAAAWPLFAWTATALELLLGISLLAGYQKRLTYLLSALLLLVFGVCMLLFASVKAPLDYSVFSAAACCLLLYRQQG